MDKELKSGKGKVLIKDSIRVITEYLIPILGKRVITRINVDLRPSVVKAAVELVLLRRDDILYDNWILKRRKIQNLK
jgi:hypothetical protein